MKEHKTVYLAFVKAYKDGYPYNGYILCEAYSKEDAKEKIANHYRIEWPDQVIEEIKVGTTVK